MVQLSILWLLRRTLFLVGHLVLTSAVYACTAAAPLPALIPISLVGGLAFGGLWALMVALTSELCGVGSPILDFTIRLVWRGREPLPHVGLDCL